MTQDELRRRCEEEAREIVYQNFLMRGAFLLKSKLFVDGAEVIGASKEREAREGETI